MDDQQQQQQQQQWGCLSPIFNVLTPDHLDPQNFSGVILESTRNGRIIDLTWAYDKGVYSAMLGENNSKILRWLYS